MKWARRWFLRGAPLWAFLLLLPAIVFFCMKLGICGRTMVERIAPHLEHSANTANYASELQSIGVQNIALRSFVSTPIREEFLFRILPFGTVWALWFVWMRQSSPPLSVALGALLVSSAWFGYIHGGVGNIFIQGFIGVVYAIVFLKWSAYGKTPLRGVLVVIVLHGTYNFAVALDVQQRIIA